MYLCKKIQSVRLILSKSTYNQAKTQTRNFVNSFKINFSIINASIHRTSSELIMWNNLTIGPSAALPSLGCDLIKFLNIPSWDETASSTASSETLHVTNNPEIQLQLHNLIGV